MSERYNVPASDVLGENYKITSVECSDYNPSIDGNITVTITVNDVYGDAISGESVTVTASEGTFTQLNGSDITASDSVTGTTNSSGQFTLTYNCSEWGLITFTANNKTTQIKVTGWKQVATTTVSGVTYTCYANGEGVGRVNVRCSSVSFPSGFSHEATNWIPEAYKPVGDYYMLLERLITDGALVYLWQYQTTIGIRNTLSSASIKSLNSTIVYSY